MVVRKENAPANDKTTDQSNPPAEPTLASPAATDPDVVSNPNPVGKSAREMQEAANVGYHDSLSGRAVTADGQFVDKTSDDEGPIPEHRIVADNWPEQQVSSQGRVEDTHLDR